MIIIALLQELSAPSALCRRNGSWTDTRVSELVVGDLIQLKGGDVIPADAKVQLIRTDKHRHCPSHKLLSPHPTIPNACP